MQLRSSISIDWSPELRRWSAIDNARNTDLFLHHAYSIQMDRTLESPLKSDELALLCHERSRGKNHSILNEHILAFSKITSPEQQSRIPLSRAQKPRL